MEKKKTSPSGEGRPAGRPLSPLAKGLLIAIAAVLVLSIAARAFLVSDAAGQPGAGGGVKVQSEGFVPGGHATASESAEKSGLEAALPIITEGSFFALLGFALGYAARKFLKIGLIVVAVFFVGLQVLSYANVIEIDWQQAVDLLDRFVLNLKENQTVTEVLTARLPSAGAFLAAFAFGFRSG